MNTEESTIEEIIKDIKQESLSYAEHIINGKKVIITNLPFIQQSGIVDIAQKKQQKLSQ